MVLEGCLNNENIAPCFLYLHCDPLGFEEIMSLGIISEARNMELYIGEEYCATGRGEKVLAVQNGRSVALCFGIIQSNFELGHYCYSLTILPLFLKPFY